MIDLVRKICHICVTEAVCFSYNFAQIIEEIVVLSVLSLWSLCEPLLQSLTELLPLPARVEGQPTSIDYTWC